MPGLFDWLFGEGIALSAIKKGIAAGLSSEEILAALEKAAVPIRPELATKVIDYLSRAILPDNEYISNLNSSVLPNITRIPLSPTKQKRNFNYLVELTGKDATTGQDVTQWVTVATNSILTKQQALDIAMGIALSTSTSGGLESSSARLDSITQRAEGLFPL